MKQYLLLLSLCSHYKLLNADVTSYETTQGAFGLSIEYTGEDNVTPYPPECIKILEQFAVNASELTKCSIRNARPIRICERCINEYVNFYGIYQKMKSTILNGTSCESYFVSQDRLDAISQYYNGILAIWNKGNCNACYNWTKDKPVLSNQVITFKQKYNDTMDCISRYPNKNFSSNHDEVCENCKPYYLKLDDYYKSMSTDSIGLDTICMDIIDTMNATRSKWSKSLNCCQLRKSPEIIFLCCTVIISILPLIYYLALRFCGPMRDLPNVLKQSRFKQIILRTVNRRIN